VSSIQIISSAGAGSQTLYGGAGLTNVAQGFIAGGLLSLALGTPLASFDLPARHVAFEFSETSEHTQRYDFTPSQRPFVARGFESQTFGVFALENQSLGIMPDGWDSSRTPAAIVSDDSLARSVAFDFTLEQPASLAQQFNFSGPQMVSSLGAWDSLTFGGQEVEAPITIPTESWDSLRLGMPRFSAPISGRNVEFDLVEVNAGDLALHFTFSGADIVAGRGSSLATFGEAAVANVAQGFLHLGWGHDSAALGSPIVSDDAAARLVEFDFTEPFSAPNAANIGFPFGGNTRSFIPGDLDSFTAGTQYVWAEPVIELVGFDSFEAGEDIGTIWLLYMESWDSFSATPFNGLHFPGYIHPHHWDSSAFGVPHFPGLVFSGLGPVAWGQTEITGTAAPVTQTADFDEKGLDATLVEDPVFISNYFRLLQDVGGISSFAYDPEEGRVSYSPQFAHLPFDNRPTEYGTPAVGFGIVIELNSAKQFARYGTAIIDHARILPSGIDSFAAGSVGTTNAGMPLGFDFNDSLFFGGTTAVYNSVNYLQFEYNCQPLGDRCGATFGQYAQVYNRNFVIRPAGFFSQRMEYFPAHVGRSGRAVVFSGFEATQWALRHEPQHMVSHYVRALPLPSIESLVFTQWSKVKNAARVIAPDAFEATDWADAFLERMLTHVPMWGRNTLEMGVDVWVGDALIPFALEGYGPNTLRIGTGHFVDYGARYLDFADQGIDSFNWATITVEGFPVPTITPWWPAQITLDSAEMGRPAVENRIKEITTDGLDALRISGKVIAWVSHSPRYLTPEPTRVTSFGRASVQDSTQAAGVTGWQSTQVSLHATLWHDPEPTILPIDAFIFPEGWESLDFGDEFGFLDTVLRPDGLDSFSAGSTVASSNGVVFDNTSSNQFGWAVYGTPVMLGGVDTVTVGEWESTTTFGQTRMSPHTLWCVEDTPQQAKENHEGDEWCEVDKFCRLGINSHPFAAPSKAVGSARSGPWFGAGTTISQAGDESASFYGDESFDDGRPVITLGTNVVEDVGSQVTRFGFPVVQGAELRTIKFREGLDALVIGTAGSFDPDAGAATNEQDHTLSAGSGNPVVVTDNGPRYADVNGFDSFVAGPSGDYQNFHRFVFVGGFEATIYGDDTPPMVYHYPRGPLMEGGITTTWGEAWLSHSPRWLSPEGLDSFASRWTDWQEAMNIENSDTIAVGFLFNDFTEWGSAAVSTGPQKFAPYGISPRCPPGVNMEVLHG